MNQIEDKAKAILNEYSLAATRFPPFHSAYEGFAIIKEELDELWDIVRTSGSTPDDWALEAIQVGAMALRFLVDLC